jgi:hypothetical protein
VPTFTCGLFLSNFSLAISASPKRNISGLLTVTTNALNFKSNR